MASSQMSNTWLWFSLGLAAFLAAKGIQYAMTDIIALTAIDPIPQVEKEPEQEQPEDSISLSTLRVLTTSPNQRIALSARSILIQRIQSSQEQMRAIHLDTSSMNPETSRLARQALRFLEEYGESPTPDDDDDGIMSETNPLAQTLEILARRRGVSADTVNERLTSLADELGVDSEDGWDWRELLGGFMPEDTSPITTRSLSPAAPPGGISINSPSHPDFEFDEQAEGHEQNARQLGVGNFAGLTDSRWAPPTRQEEDRAMNWMTGDQPHPWGRQERPPSYMRADVEDRVQRMREQDERNRRSRREAMVVQDDTEESEEGEQRGWWVV